MRRNNNDLFTLSYGTLFDGWVQIDPQNLANGFFQSYSRKTNTINIRRSDYILFIEIIDSNNKVVYKGHIYTIRQYLSLKKELKWT